MGVPQREADAGRAGGGGQPQRGRETRTRYSAQGNNLTLLTFLSRFRTLVFIY